MVVLHDYWTVLCWCYLRSQLQSTVYAVCCSLMRYQYLYLASQWLPVAVCIFQAMSKGVSWFQPFVQLQANAGASGGGAAAAVAAATSAVAAAAAGRDHAQLQGSFTVVVQPQLPLIKVGLSAVTCRAGRLRRCLNITNSSCMQHKPHNTGKQYTRCCLCHSNLPAMPRQTCHSCCQSLFLIASMLFVRMCTDSHPHVSAVAVGVLSCVLVVCQASLQGPEVQLTLPSDEELSAFTAAAATSSSSSTQGRGPAASWAPASVSTSAAAAAGSGAVGMVGADLEKKASAVVVFEGQVLSWTLCLTNISSQPITGCKVRPAGARAIQYNTVMRGQVPTWTLSQRARGSRGLCMILCVPQPVPACKEHSVWLPMEAC